MLKLIYKLLAKASAGIGEKAAVTLHHDGRVDFSTSNAGGATSFQSFVSPDEFKRAMADGAGDTDGDHDVGDPGTPTDLL